LGRLQKRKRKWCVSTVAKRSPKDDICIENFQRRPGGGRGEKETTRITDQQKEVVRSAIDKSWKRLQDIKSVAQKLCNRLVTGARTEKRGLRH